MTGAEIIKAVEENYPDLKIWCADGFDDACIGYDEDANRLIYSEKKAMDIVFKGMKATRADLSPEEKAEGMTVREKRWELSKEHFEFNVAGAKGEGTAIWCRDLFY